MDEVGRLRNRQVKRPLMAHAAVRAVHADVRRPYATGSRSQIKADISNSGTAERPVRPRTVRGVEYWRDDNQDSACAVALVSRGAVPRT